MGCNCGKKRNLNALRRATVANEQKIASSRVASNPAPSVVSQQTQNQLSSLSSQSVQRNSNPVTSQRNLNTETEKKRRIQISLRNRNLKRRG